MGDPPEVPVGRGVAVRDAEGRAIRFMTCSVDITDLNQRQYERQLAAGCPPVTARTPITSGNITVWVGTWVRPAV